MDTAPHSVGSGCISTPCLPNGAERKIDGRQIINHSQLSTSWIKQSATIRRPSEHLHSKRWSKGRRWSFEGSVTCTGFQPTPVSPSDESNDTSDQTTVSGIRAPAPQLSAFFRHFNQAQTHVTTNLSGQAGIQLGCCKSAVELEARNSFGCGAGLSAGGGISG